jgi:hypothetical protein
MLVYSALVKMCMKKRDSICRVARSRKDLPSRADRLESLAQRGLRAAMTKVTLTTGPLTSTTISKGDLNVRGSWQGETLSHKQVNGCCFDLQGIFLQLVFDRGVAGNATITPYQPSAGFPPGILGTARLRTFFFQPTDPCSPARGQDKLLGW